MARKATWEPEAEKKYFIVAEPGECDEVRDVICDSVEEAASYCLTLGSSRTFGIFEGVVVGHVKPSFVPRTE